MQLINLEIKAKIRDLEEMTTIIKDFGARFIVSRKERDIYFNTKSGSSLKLKYIGSIANLLYYQKNPTSKELKFMVIENIPEPQKLESILGDVLGTKTSIEKIKTIYQYNKATISFSEIKDLGKFIEVQVPVWSTDREARQFLEELRTRLKISEEDIESSTYAEILESKGYAQDES